MKVITRGTSIGALAIALAAPGHAQDTSQAAAQPAARTGGVQMMVVTAQRRSEDLQDVPVSVQAINSEALEQLNINTFDDYLEQLPTVTAGGSGPGQNTIYIRGLASTTPNLTTAGVAGLAPNVSLYLDEQPLAQPGRNLDVYAADLERIEVLSGPQGTLFGASSQAGVVRLITNKPSLSGIAASGTAGLEFTKNGEPSYKFEAMLNVPVTDTFALRGVVYLDERGGYVDNVRGTRDVSESGRFRPAGTIRDNGVPVAPRRGGFQAGADLSNVNFLTADNQGRVQDDFNDTRYAGFRASALWEVTPDWTINVAHSRQSLESDGVFFSDPELNGLEDLQIQRFQDDRLEDSFSNTSWTVEGRLGMLDIVYSGAYTDRKTEQKVDYSDYLFVGQYIPYYICDTAVSYPGYVSAMPADPTCQAPNLNVDSRTETSVFTQEFRVSTPQDARFRVTAGGFYSNLILEELNDFNYTGSPFVRGSDGVTQGFAPNFPLTNINAPPGAVGNASDGYFSDAGPFPTGTSFRNDIRRTDKQYGLFGEASFEILPDVLTITGGARYYDISVDLEGSANASFFNLNSPIFSSTPGVDAQRGGTNISAQFAPDNAVGAPDKAKTSGVIFKGTLTFTPTDNIMVYATYSEGFRPGLLNRPGGAQTGLPGGGTYTVPFALDTDEVKNYEIGWKTDIFDRQLRVNGSAFYVDISRLQTTIFDPSITNLFFSDNAANAEILGVEGDFIFAPYAVPGLTIAGAVSFLDTKITDVLVPTDDVVVGSNLAFAPSFQGNLRVRYEWALSRKIDAHIMPQVSHSSSKFTDIIEINKLQLNSYTIANLSAGISSDSWKFEVYADNLFDTRAEISGNFVFDRARIVTNRPLTIGMRAGFNF